MVHCEALKIEEKKRENGKDWFIVKFKKLKKRKEKMVEIGPLLSVKFKKERKRKEKMEKIDPLCCDDCPVM